MGSGGTGAGGRAGALIRFGPAGWSYPDWEGPVYPEKKPKGFDPLAFLADYFDTIEINSTFYRPAQPHAARSWVRRIEKNPRFKFTAKLWQRFTHERDAPWNQDDVDAVREGLDPIAERGRLGALLVQFPWSFKNTEETCDWLGDIATALRPYPRVVEVRHASWNTPEFYQWLADEGIGFVNIDQPLFRRSIKPSATATAPVGYVRLHGRNYEDWFREGAGRDARYDYLYSAQELAPWAERIRDLAASGPAEEVYAIANNHRRGQAAANAIMLASLVRGERQHAPETLVAAYPDVLAPYAAAVAVQPRLL